MTLEGVDVSNWQPGIDWHDVKNAGIRFAGLKATEGVNIIDPTFTYNWVQARHNGIHRIAYHYLRPERDGNRQAGHFLFAVHEAGGFMPGDAIMLDIEESDGQSPAKVVKCAEGFIVNVLHHTHCGVYVYTNEDTWKYRLREPHSSVITHCPLWQASYGSPPNQLSGWPDGVSIWQYTNTGSVPGINGGVDRDRFMGDEVEYRVLAMKGGR